MTQPIEAMLARWPLLYPETTDSDEHNGNGPDWAAKVRRQDLTDHHAQSARPKHHSKHPNQPRPRPAPGQGISTPSTPRKGAPGLPWGRE